MADCVSVLAVTLVCDEKRRLGEAANLRGGTFPVAFTLSRVELCRRFGRPPFGYPPRLRSGLRQSRAGFLEKREKWRTQAVSLDVKKTNALYLPLKWPTRLGSFPPGLGRLSGSKSTRSFGADAAISSTYVQKGDPFALCSSTGPWHYHSTKILITSLVHHS